MVDTTRRDFDEALAELRTDVIRLAAMVGESIGAGTHALLDSDLQMADRVIGGHRPIDELNASIELRTYQLFALKQPMAVDLRTLIAVLRILQELDLTGALMASIAKAARRLYPHDLPPRIRGLIEQMGAQASVQLHLAVDAFADVDSSLAGALGDIDDVMDDLQKQLFRAIFDTCEKDEAGLQQAVQMALVGRYYERVADHAVQIARWVDFMVTGDLPGHAATAEGDEGAEGEQTGA